MPEQAPKKTSKVPQKKNYSELTCSKNKKRRVARHAKRLLKKEQHVKRWVKKNLGEEMASKVVMDPQTKRLGVRVGDSSAEANTMVRGNMRQFRRMVHKARHGTK